MPNQTSNWHSSLESAEFACELLKEAIPQAESMPLAGVPDAFEKA